MCSKLSATIGAQAPGGMMLYLVISGVYLTWLRRPVGRFTVNEQRLEGEFRFVNSRLIQNSEEIAFYQVCVCPCVCVCVSVCLCLR